jgi:hypothetical protein
MQNAHRLNTPMPTSLTNGKNSLTFESVVCSQLELKRRAASFSRRRSTTCRRPSIYMPPLSPPLTPILSQSNARTSLSTVADVSGQLLQTKSSNTDGKHSRASSVISITGPPLGSTRERQSLVSMLYWDTNSRSPPTKKV